MVKFRDMNEKKLQKLIEKIIYQGNLYLEKNTKDGSFDTFISPNKYFTKKEESPKDIASSSLILGTAFEKKTDLSDKIANYLLNQANDDLTFHFFEDKALLPADADTTSITLNSLLELGYISINDTTPVLNKILNNQSKEGFNIYFNPEAYNKVNTKDLVASCNIGSFLSHHQALEEFAEELERIKNYFKKEEYLRGQRYWFSPSSSLYYASKLYKEIRDEELHSILVTTYNQITGTTNFSLDIAMRIAAHNLIRLETNSEIDSLLENIIKKGKVNFPIDAIYKRGSREEYFGNEAILAGFIINVLNEAFYQKSII